MARKRRKEPLASQPMNLSGSDDKLMESGLSKDDIDRARSLIEAAEEVITGEISSLPQGLQEAVIEALAKKGRSEAITHLQAVEALSSPTAKAVRRALHYLKTQRLIEPTPTLAKAFVLPREQKEEIRAVMSLPDYHGHRVILYPVTQFGRGLEAIAGHIGDTDGAMELEVVSLARRDWPKLAESFEAQLREQTPWYSADLPSQVVSEAIRLAALASERWERKNDLLPEIWARLESREPEWMHPARREVGPLDREESLSLIRRSALITEESYLGFLPPPAMMLKLLKAIEGIMDPVIAVPGASPKHQVTAAIMENIGELMKDYVYRMVLIHRFLDMALIFHKLGERDRARLYLALAQELGPEGLAPEENPFFIYAIEKALMRREEGAEAEEEVTPGGIILPFGAQERRTESGGIILLDE